MSSKIKQYFANKENRIKCGITGGTIALAVIIFVGMVFMEENETQNNSIETVSQTESDTQTEEETGYSFIGFFPFLVYLTLSVCCLGVGKSLQYSGYLTLMPSIK